VAVLAMFPLGTVLFPGGVLPLHVFEPRYRQLVHDCLAADDPEFGVVLIERGSEVGGGDIRRPVGVVARMVEVAELEGGRYAVVAIGTRRIQVTAWLPDEPYPRAEVEEWPDEAPEPDFEERLAGVIVSLRRVLALVAELGQAAAPATVELADDPRLAIYHAAALAPLGPADQYDLLIAPGPDERARRLATMLADAEAVARFRLSAGSSASDQEGDDPGVDDGGA
jgi:Lon protease-like protein